MADIELMHSSNKPLGFALLKKLQGCTAGRGKERQTFYSNKVLSILGYRCFVGFKTSSIRKTRKGVRLVSAGYQKHLIGSVCIAALLLVSFWSHSFRKKAAKNLQKNFIAFFN